MNAGQRLVRDFVAAARHAAAGDHDSALACLLPADAPLELRLPWMLCVGALLSGTLASGCAGPGPGGLAAAGAEVDAEGIRELIAARCAGVHTGLLIDVLVTFVVAFAAWETAGPHAAEESFREAALWLG